MPGSCRTRAVFPLLSLAAGCPAASLPSRVVPRLHVVTGFPVPVPARPPRPARSPGNRRARAARTYVRRHCSSVRVHRSTRSGVSPSQLTHPPRNPWRMLVDRPRSVERDDCCLVLSHACCHRTHLASLITVVINFAVALPPAWAARRHDPARGQPEKYASPGIQSSSWVIKNAGPRSPGEPLRVQWMP